jgi:hypothetical protein
MEVFEAPRIRRYANGLLILLSPFRQMLSQECGGRPRLPEFGAATFRRMRPLQWNRLLRGVGATRTFL